MKLTRRAVLRALGVSPMAAPVLAQQLSTMAASGAGLLGNDGSDQGCAAVAEQPPRIFRSVTAWWKAFGEDEIRRQTRYVTQFDADIISLHLPLQTKVAFHRRRNFERQKAERFRDMAERLTRDGQIKWWP